MGGSGTHVVLSVAFGVDLPLDAFANGKAAHPTTR